MPEEVLISGPLFLHGSYKMVKQKAYLPLHLPCRLLLSTCTPGVKPSDKSTSSLDAQFPKWAVKFQHQSSFTDKALPEITDTDLKPGDLLSSSGLGLTLFDIALFLLPWR